MVFQIGKAAKLLGVSTEGLRLYERAGILKPHRGKDDTSYRTYEHLDFTALIRARGYHNYGFSTKEIANLINAPELNHICQQYEQREHDLEREIQWKTLLLENLQELKRLSLNVTYNPQEITQCVRPAMYRFPFIEDAEYLLNTKQEKIFQQWISKSPIVFISQSNRWEDLQNGCSQIAAALGILEKHAAFLELDLQGASYYPSSPALYCIVREQGDDFQPLICLRPLMDYVAKERLTVAGDPISRVFLSFNKNDSYTRYREVWLPIQKSK